MIPEHVTALLNSITNRLASTEATITLTRTQIVAILDTIKGLTQKASALEVLPDGRVVFGNLVSGYPSALADSDMASMSNFFAGNYEMSFRCSKDALVFYESSQNAIEKLHLTVPNEIPKSTIEDMYARAAYSAVQLFLDKHEPGYANVAYRLESKALAITNSLRNKVAFGWTAIFVERSDEAKQAFAWAAQDETNGNERIKLQLMSASTDLWINKIKALSKMQTVAPPR